MENPPVRLAKIAIGDGSMCFTLNVVFIYSISSAMGGEGTYLHYPVPSILQTYPQLISFNSSVYEYYVNQWSKCRYNVALHYPATSLYPTLGDPNYLRQAQAKYSLDDARSDLRKLIKLASAGPGEDNILHEGRIYRRQAATAPTLPMPQLNNTEVDPFYGCYVWYSMREYAKHQIPFSELNRPREEANVNASSRHQW